MKYKYPIIFGLWIFYPDLGLRRQKSKLSLCLDSLVFSCDQSLNSLGNKFICLVGSGLFRKLLSFLIKSRFLRNSSPNMEYMEYIAFYFL